jgi:diguanylate cyclase (GGDEF)-like protein
MARAELAGQVAGVEFVGELRHGSRSTVYRVRRDGRDHALKLLHSSAVDPAARSQFRREAALLASLDHPGVAHIYEVGEVDGRPYLIMELIEGESLTDQLAGGPLPEATVVDLVSQVAEALAAAHRAGRVHRDIKPHNIMVRADGAACLIDFGLATRIGNDIGDSAVGTFSYSAPEQTGMLRRTVDGRADLYALGVVAYQCLTGALPFEAADASELILQHASTPAPPVRQSRPDVSPALSAVVAKLLAKDPDDRYQTPEGLRADLARINAGQTEEFPLGAGDVRSDSYGAAPLVGRTAEADRLMARWRDASGGHGGVALIEGPPGGGKSRLAREVSAEVEGYGGLTWYGKCAADGSPLAPLREAVDGYLDRVDELDEAQRSATEQRIRTAAGEAAGLLASLSPRLAARLGADALSGQDNQRQFAEAVAVFLTGLADTAGGAVLHLDDLQWTDEATARVLRQLATIIDTSSLLVVATGRNDAASVPAVRAITADLGPACDLRITLGALDEHAVAELVAAQLGSFVVPDELIARLAARSGGNPLAVLEYVRAVLDAGLVRPSWGTWLLDEAGLDALALPDDVMDLILRRVTALGPEPRRLLTVAAAVGGRFQVDLVAEVCQVDRPATAAALTDAAGHQLVEPVGGGTFAFLHDRMREALVAGLDEASRRQTHQAIAEALEALGETGPEYVYAVARHYLLGETDRTPDRVYRAAAAAGALAIAQYATHDAVEYLTQAEAAADTAGITPDATFRTNLGIAASRYGTYDLADHELRRALEVADSPNERARLYSLLAESCYLRWNGDQAMEMARLGLAELGHPLPRHPLALVISTLGWLLLGLVTGLVPKRWRLATGEARERYRLRAELILIGAYASGVGTRRPMMAALNFRALYLAQRLQSGAEFARINTGLATVSAAVFGLRRLPKRLIARAMAAVASSGDPRLISHIHWMQGIVMDVASPITATSGRTMQRALERYGRYVDVGEYLGGAGIVGHYQLFRGDLDEAEAWYRRTRERTASTTETLGNVNATIGAQAAALAGRPAEATAMLDEVRQFLATTPENRAQEINVALAAVNLTVEQGEIGEVLDRTLAEFTAIVGKPSEVFSYHRAFWVYQAFGRIAQAAVADSPQRTQRLDQARRAVSDLGRAAKGPVLGAFHRTAQASLSEVEGDPAGALRQLATVDAVPGLNSPRLAYEVARIRARAQAALGFFADARYQAELALGIASERGWRGRARWVSTEFDVDRPAGTVTGTVARSSASRHGTDHRGAAAGGEDVQRRRLKAVLEVSLAASQIIEPDRLARVALDEIVRIFGAERAFLFLADPDTDQLKPYLGRDGAGNQLDHLTGYGSTLVHRVHESGEPIVVTGSEEGAALGSQSTLVHGLRSIMIAPLELPGRVIGVVYLDSRAARGIFTNDDVEILASITSHIALSLETTRTAQLELAVHTAQRERDLAESLRRTTTNLAATRDPEDVTVRLLTSITQTLPAHTAILLHRAGPQAPLTLAAYTADPQWTHTLQARVEAIDPANPATLAGDPRLAGLLAQRRAQRHTSAEQTPPLPTLFGPQTNAWLAVPLHLHGTDRGLLIMGTEHAAFSDTEFEIAATLSGQGLAALENALLFHQIEDLAIRDGLTGLHNRRHFTELADAELSLDDATAEPVAALMIDIDNFKKINDRYGHAVGDLVIQHVAHRLAENLRIGDLICRYGGEEFAVLLPRSGELQARAAAERLHAAIGDQVIATPAGPVSVTVSVGLAPPAPHRTDLGELLGAADGALYQAKRAGRDRVGVSSS